MTMKRTLVIRPMMMNSSMLSTVRFGEYGIIQASSYQANNVLSIVIFGSIVIHRPMVIRLLMIDCSVFSVVRFEIIAIH